MQRRTGVRKRFCAIEKGSLITSLPTLTFALEPNGQLLSQLTCNRAAHGVLKKLRALERELPFEIKG